MAPWEWHRHDVRRRTLWPWDVLRQGTASPDAGGGGGGDSGHSIAGGNPKRRCTFKGRGAGTTQGGGAFASGRHRGNSEGPGHMNWPISWGGERLGHMPWPFSWGGSMPDSNCCRGCSWRSSREGCGNHATIPRGCKGQRWAEPQPQQQQQQQRRRRRQQQPGRRFHTPGRSSNVWLLMGGMTFSSCTDSRTLRVFGNEQNNLLIQQGWPTADAAARCSDRVVGTDE